MALIQGFAEIPLSPSLRGAVGSDVSAVRRWAGPTSNMIALLEEIFGTTEPGGNFPTTKPYGDPTIVTGKPYPGTTLLMPETFSVNMDSEAQREIADLDDVNLGADCCVIDVTYRYQNCTDIPFYISPEDAPEFSEGTCLRISRTRKVSLQTIPGRLLRYQAEPAAISNGAAPPEPDDVVPNDVFAPVRVPSEIWRIEWAHVIQPDFDLIQELKGTCNAERLWGFPPHSVLFEDMDSSWYYDFRGHVRHNFYFDFNIETFNLPEGHTIPEPTAINNKMGRLNRSWSKYPWNDGVGNQNWRLIRSNGKLPIDETTKLKDIFKYAA